MDLSLRHINQLAQYFIWELVSVCMCSFVFIIHQAQRQFLLPCTKGSVATLMLSEVTLHQKLLKDSLEIKH